MILGNKNIINNTAEKIEELRYEISRLKIEQRGLYDKIFNNSLWLNFETDTLVSLLPTLISVELLNYICYRLDLVSDPVEKVMLFSTLIISVLPNMIIELLNRYYLKNANNLDQTISRKNSELIELTEKNRVFKDFIDYVAMVDEINSNNIEIDDLTESKKLGIK